MQPMFLHIIDDVLAKGSLDDPRDIVEVHAWGLAEAIAGERIEELMQHEDPRVAILMGAHGVTARVISSKPEAVSQVVEQIETCWEPWVYGRNDATIGTSLGEVLQRRGETMAAAESCTGGLVSDLAVQVSGASDWFCGGWVTYTNELKHTQLGVSLDVIDEYGAVSWQVAKAMCEGAISHSGATVAVSTTGIAGPDVGSEDKPVGTVYIGCVVNGKVEVRLFRFTGDRQHIRTRTAYTAIQMMRLRLEGINAPKMCWQQGEVRTC